MDRLKKQLILLYDEMFEKVSEFNRHTYNDIFLEAFAKYESFVLDIEYLVEDTPRENRNDVIEELACVLPEYVKGKISKLSKKELNKTELNYSVNMAVYVLPIITYSHENYCEKLAKRTVDVWNEMKVTSLVIGYSSYESIVAGFKKRLCYITTAVCEHQNKADDCYELTTLRNYRDEYLMQTQSGCKLVDEYYDLAPGIVMVINMQQNADDIYQNIYKQYLIPCLQYIEEGKNEECCNLYMQMVRSLQKKYLYS